MPENPIERLRGRWPRQMPLRMVLIVPFVVQIVGAVGLVGYLSFRNGQQAVNSVAFQLCAEIGDRIDQELHVFLDAPHIIHQNSKAAIDLGYIDVRDLTGLRRHFWRQVNIFSTVKDIGLGNAHGELVAVSSVESGTGTVRLLNAATNHDMKVYRVDDAGEPTELDHITRDFDPLQRPWYRDAAAAEGPTWTEIFPTYGREGLAISAVHPIYDAQNNLTAVLYNLLNLDQMDAFLRGLEIGKTGQSFILEPGGLLVATSTGEALLHQMTTSQERLVATNSSDPITQATSQYLLDTFGSFQNIQANRQIRFQIDREPYFLQVMPFHDPRGLDWLVVVVVPEADFMAQIYANTRNTALLCLLALGGATIAGVLITRWIARSIGEVSEASAAVAEGDLNQRIAPNPITEISQLAVAFNSMAHQLNTSFAELESKNDDLQTLDQLKNEFLANTSHELRTPLNGMIGISESMLDGATGALSQEQHYNLKLIARSGKRLVNLVNDILDFSKLRHRELRLHLQPVGLRELVEVVLKLNRTFVGQKPVTLLNRVPADLPLVQADENRLQQILHNLISNAIKFTPQGQIEITARLVEGATEAARVEIAVADTGIGIPADKLERIFESFEQVEGSARRQYGGTGLGLPITRNLVELHGGHIEVESTLGEGTVFTFTLPVSDRARAIPASPPKPIPALEPEPAAFSAASRLPETGDRPAAPATLVADGATLPLTHILIVDDEPVNLQVLKNFLKFQNYTLTFASDGQAALALLDQGLQPDIILLDVMMPRMTGYEVVQVIRQRMPADQLPIILLSARNQPEDIVMGLEAGANDYLTKPIHKDELLARLHTHLQIRQLEEETVRLTVAHEQQLAKFLDALPIGVAVHNPDGSIFYFNPKAKQLLPQDKPQPAEADQLAATYRVYRSGTDSLYPTDELPAIRTLRGSACALKILRFAPRTPSHRWR